ncbi:MAG: type II secretion system protein [Pirellulales bacterium]|nr:type II secretion system protein [Pirellulales bacterium]
MRQQISAPPQAPRRRVSTSSSAHCPLTTDHSPAKGRRAFTLVELLMVIVIIGILVALVTVAVARAITSAKQTAVLAEISQLSMALEQYQQKHGSYPPNPGTEETDPQRQQRLERHFRRMFPRVVGNYTAIEAAIRNATTFSQAPYTTGLKLEDLDGAEALVFFLGGLPNPESSNLLTGFAADPAKPFQSSNDQSQRTQRFFEFDPTRLADFDGDGWPEYVPKINAGVFTDALGRTFTSAPYVYFDSGSYELGPHYPFFHDDVTVQARLAGYWGYAVPYGSQRDTTIGNALEPWTWAMTANGWQEPGKFQIICAGLDGNYGSRPDPLSITDEDEIWKRVFPSGEGYKTNIPLGGAYLDLDSDNLTNFAEKPIGEVEAPQ